MRRFWAFIIIAAIAVACQHDEERLDVVVGGEVSTVVEVTVPDSETRTSEYGSDKSVFENGVFSQTRDVQCNTLRATGEIQQRQKHCL